MEILRFFFCLFVFVFLSKSILRWLNSTIDSMDMNLSKFRDTEGQGSLTSVHGVAKSLTQLSNWTTTNPEAGLPRRGLGGGRAWGPTGQGLWLPQLAPRGRNLLSSPTEELGLSTNFRTETGYLQVGRLSLPLNVKSLVSVTFRARFIASGFPDGSDKESACNAEDLGSTPGLGRSPGGGHGNPLQYSCLENLMDREAWQATVHGVTKGPNNSTAL